MAPNPAFASFSLDPEVPPALVRFSSNEVWRASRGGQTVYLRITPAAHRSQAEVEAELAWMNALVDQEVRVVRPIVSTAGRFVEPTSWQERAACVACFAAAPGRHARKPEDFAIAGVIESWALLLGDLHRHAHAPAVAGAARRHAWDQDRVFLVAQEARDDRSRPAQEVLRALVGWMRQLDTGADAYGLTHADLHFGNLSVAGDSVTAFDFDDACTHWFIHDVAVAVTSIRKAAWEAPGHFDPAAVASAFVTAYLRRYQLGRDWQDRLEAFVAYRIALSACWASRSLELGELDEDMRAWYERSMPWWLGQLAERRAEVRAAMAV